MFVWNGVVASVPALVVQPSTPEEIAAAVAFARENGLLLKIYDAGCEESKTALAERCLTLDLSWLPEPD